MEVALRSTSVQRTPRWPRSRARVRPTGPAPTMRTSVTAEGMLQVIIAAPEGRQLRGVARWELSRHQRGDAILCTLRQGGHALGLQVAGGHGGLQLRRNVSHDRS